MNGLIRTFAAWLFVLLVFGGVAQAARTGSCITAAVDAPIVLPGGAVHPAGTLTLCISDHYSPVASLHKTSVNGMTVGLFLGRRGRSEGQEDRPFMMFVEDPYGRLHLYGYTTPTRDHLVTYRLIDTARSKRGGARTFSPGPDAVAGGGPVVLTAHASEPRPHR